MDSTIIVAVVSLIGTLGGSIITGMISNNKTLYRISELEKKVERHNNVVERMALAEQREKSLQHQINEIKEEQK